jgi:hypothetical protein
LTTSPSSSNWKEEFKKEFTWNNTKIWISAFIPMSIGGWLYVQWFNLLIPIINHYIGSIATPGTQEQAIILSCLIMGLVFPMWGLFLWPMEFGLWLGKVTRFYRYDKTRSVWWDDVTYSVKNMPQEQRDQIKQILYPYKSKVQLRKEKLANKSWLRRTFS